VSEQDNTRPRRLDAAAALYFGPDSRITGRSLAHAIRKGELGAVRLQGKLFTSFADLGPVTSRPPSRNEARPVADAVARCAAAIDAIGDRP
jgi:hypothetical protein